MPGLNRTQDQLISQVDLAAMLAGYQLVPSKYLADQQAIIARLAERMKRPSVFYQGLLNFDAVCTYTPQQSGAAAALWASIGMTTVKVFNLQDADLFKFTGSFFLENGNGPGSPFQLGYMLSVSDVFNQIDFAQSACFSQSTLGAFNEPALSNDAIYQGFSDEIPVSGNKYIHIFGGNSNLDGVGEVIDFWSYLSTAAGSRLFPAFSYSLIK